MSNIRYVTYNEFVDLLHQIAIEYFPNIPGAKRLKKFTKLIYASVMHSIPDIASYFHETKRRHQRTTMIYAPRLFVFTTEAPPEESPSASMLSDRHYDGNMMNNRSTMPLKGLDRRNISLFPDNDKSSADTTQIMMEAKPNETRKSISDIKPRKKRKSVFKKACGSCLANFAKKNEKCIKKILIVPNKLGDWIDAGVKRLGQHLGFDVGKF